MPVPTRPGRFRTIRARNITFAWIGRRGARDESRYTLLAAHPRKHGCARLLPPEEIHVPGVAKPFMFLDGGITVYNNPAFQLFLMATLPPYNLCWPTGEDQLLLVSSVPASVKTRTSICASAR